MHLPKAEGAHQRIMDDLDALLADLQNTTANISSYQNSQSQARPQHQQHLQQQQQQQQQQYFPESQPAVNNSGNNSYFFQQQQQQHHQYNDQNYTANPVTDRVDQYQQYHQQQQPQRQQQQQQQQQHQPYYILEFDPDLQRQQDGLRGAGPDSFGDPSERNGASLRSPGQGYPAGVTANAAPPPYSVQTVQRVSYTSSEGRSGSSTPPPLPPPPPSEVLDGLVLAQEQQPIYEPQTFHARESTPSSSISDSNAPQLQRDDHQLVQQRVQIRGRGERMSALSNNLSELDQLLQDLNSAQFMAEVDRKSSLGVIEPPPSVNGVSRHPPPPVAPKPSTVRPGQPGQPGQRSSVDNLLDQLEGNTAGSPQPGKFPVEPHYQELSSVTTNHSQVPGFPVPPQSSSTSSYPPVQNASLATKELDELMMSLSEFKLQNKPGESEAVSDADLEPAYARPIKSRSVSSASPSSPHDPVIPPQQPQDQGQLESMLGDLQSDMNKQGVNTKQKGVCAACNKPIVGQVIAALGRTWHVEHFVCAHCEEPLGTRNFYERDSLAYCETDYHHLFAPRCAYCNGPIVDKCITALEKMWHPEHFFCAQCGRLFGDEDFHEKNGKAYCKEDYYQMFAPKCGGCCQPIMENYISALNRQWHPECFVCWDCRATFGSGNFFDYEGLPYCETHYHAKKGSLCASCEKPITGRCITAMFKKFHPEHFVCAFCLKQLNKGTFKEQNDKPYCHPCFVKLFG